MASDDPPHAAGAPPTVGPRFFDAVAEAQRLHPIQVRKGTATPYLAHLLAVAALVLEDGGDEDDAIAALLHDGPEDAGGEKTLAAIRHRFGDRVADIVAGCSDTFETPKPPWCERKRAYLEHLADPATPQAVLRVSLADKLHNARAILSITAPRASGCGSALPPTARRSSSGTTARSPRCSHSGGRGRQRMSSGGSWPSSSGWSGSASARGRAGRGRQRPAARRPGR